MTGFLTHAIMEKKIAEVKEMGLFDRLIKRKQKQNYKPLVIYGLCGPVGVGAHKSGEARYWTASIILRAWKEEGSEALHEEKIRLEKTCDEDGVHALQEQLRKNAIFHAKVRMSEQGLELLELLEPDCDEPQLAALRGVQEDARTETAVDPEVAEGRCRIQTFAKEKTRIHPPVRYQYRTGGCISTRGCSGKTARGQGRLRQDGTEGERDRGRAV